MIKAQFEREFDHVRVLNNLILPNIEGARVPSVEMDTCVVCEGGIYMFEIKPWENCEVHSFKVEGESERQWQLHYKDGGVRELTRDPYNQIAGKHKAVLPVVTDAIKAEAIARADALSRALEASLGADRAQAVAKSLEESFEVSVGGADDPVSAPKPPTVRFAGYLLLPMAGVTLGPKMNASVLTASDLPYVVRRLRADSRRDRDRKHIACMDEGLVNVVADALERAGRVISPEQHLQNIKDVFGDSKPIVVIRPPAPAVCFEASQAGLPAAGGFGGVPNE